MELPTGRPPLHGHLQNARDFVRAALARLVDDLRRRNERERATMLDPLADQTPPAGIASSVLVAAHLAIWILIYPRRLPLARNISFAARRLRKPDAIRHNEIALDRCTIGGE